MKSLSKSILLGTSIGDALGVPVEFLSREELDRNRVNDMRGYGTHNQPAGTWSDDTSLSLCLADSLCNGYNLQDIADKFVLWMDNGLWTPYGFVFDIGIATSCAICNIKKGISPGMTGLNGEYDNGNGSLMRILPLLIHIYSLSQKERIQKIEEVSSITHRHPRSILGCIIFMEFARNLLTHSIEDSFKLMQKDVCSLIEQVTSLKEESVHFNRILLFSFKDYKSIPRKDIYSSGYVVHTLEASLWCIVNSLNFKDAVLSAVNLGNDADTTGAVTGGLAALVYGYESIPQEWLNRLARKNDLICLAERLEAELQ